MNMKPISHITQLLVLMIAAFVLASSLENGRVSKVSQVLRNGKWQVETRNNIIRLTITTNGVTMHNVLRTKNPGTPNRPLEINPECGLNMICVMSGNITYATLKSHPGDVKLSVSRVISNPDAELTDCYELGDGIQWFGGPQLQHQRWPIQNMYYEEEPYLPTHRENMAISERYWLSSKGIYLFVSEKDPLFLDQNNYKAGYLCFISKNKPPYRIRNLITLNYEIGAFADPRQAHENAVSNLLGKPRGHPHDTIIHHTVWSTSARYKSNISERVVEDFAVQIWVYQFKNSQLEIDNNWESCYGSAEFDRRKFPNITGLAASLKNKGFRVTLWIHPFINEGCEPAYSTAYNNSYFVKNLDGSVHTSWRQGMHSAVIDFTNPNAVRWWVARLKQLQKTGIDSFKFDAGEVSWLPQTPSLTGALDMQPGKFTTDYVNTLWKNFADNIEVSVGWRSQDLPIYVRMIDKNTKWTWNNGLPTLITTLLQMNLNGYVYVLPSMVGGNGYLTRSLNSTVYPSKELFIRWLQASVFMPALQFSFAPWDFDSETQTITWKYKDLRYAYAARIWNLMRKSIQTGAPLNPPIW